MAKDPAKLPCKGDEAALMMRSLAALAAAVPVEDTVETEDDPLALPAQRTPGPNALPPQMLPPAVDPALERAMMGYVATPAPERAEGVRSRAAFVLKRWWPAAAGAGVAAALVIAPSLRD